MPEHVVYLARSDQFVFETKRKDWEFLCAAVFNDVRERFRHPAGEKVVQLREDLLDSAKFILNVIHSDPLLMYEYRYSMTIHDLPEAMRGYPIICGFHLDGKMYHVDARMAICELREIGIGPDGHGFDTGHRVDVRDQIKIISDEGHIVHISKRKLAGIVWPEVLPPLIEFLEDQPDEEISVCLKMPPPTVKQIIRSYLKGGGEDDFVCEALQEVGTSAKDELLRMLQDERAKKYHHAVAELLLLAFPSAESRQAVEERASAESNETARAGLQEAIKLYGSLAMPGDGAI